MGSIFTWLRPGAEDRIRKHMNESTPGERGTAFTSMLVFEVVGKTTDELEAIRAEIAEIAESRKSIADAYEGQHRADKSYSRGSLVTSKGSLWLCLLDTAEAPGRSADWRMVAKSGDKPQ